MKAAAISLTNLRASRTSTATALRTLAAAAIVLLTAIVRMEATVAGAVDVRAAEVAADVPAAEVAAGVPVAAGAIVADAVGPAGGDTRTLATDLRG